MLRKTTATTNKTSPATSSLTSKTNNSLLLLLLEEEDEEKNKKQQQQRPTTITKRKICLFLLLLLLVVYATVLQILEFNAIAQEQQLLEDIITSDTNNNANNANNAADVIPDCTFDELWNAFSSPSQQQQQEQQYEQDKQQQNKCWSFQSQVLNIPVDAIQNRNTMTNLGSGHFGGVWKALIQMSSSEDNNNKTYCWAALKTDSCHSLLLNFKSCISDNAHHLRGHSFLGNEYKGAFLYYAWQKRQQRLLLLGKHNNHQNNNNQNNNKEEQQQYPAAGFMPCWGVVSTNNNNNNNNNNPFFFWQQNWRISYGSWVVQSPHPDPSIVAAIFPLVQFQRFDAHAITKLQEQFSDIQLAHIFLPVAQAIEFYHAMGFYHQDIIPENIGLVYIDETTKQQLQVQASSSSTTITTNNNNMTTTTPYHAILFDNTFLSPMEPCTHDQDDLCRYCPEPALQHSTPWMGRKDYPELLVNIRNALQCKQRGGNSELCAALRAHNIPNASALVQALETYITTTTTTQI